MFGRNGRKGRSGRSSNGDTVVRPEGKFEVADSIEIECETDSLVISQGGFFNGNVAKVPKHDAHSGPRPVHLVEDRRLGAQK